MWGQALREVPESETAGRMQLWPIGNHPKSGRISNRFTFLNFFSRIMQVVTQKHGTASKRTSAKTWTTSVAELLVRESMLMSSWHFLVKKRKERTWKKSQYSWTSTMNSRGNHFPVSVLILKKGWHTTVKAFPIQQLCCYFVLIWVILGCSRKLSLVEGRFSKWF